MRYKTDHRLFLRAPVAATMLALTSFAAAQNQGEWTLFCPIGSNETQLVDLDNNVVQTWESAFTPGASVYLVDDGAILRPANDPSAGDFGGPGLGGRIERIAWDGTVEWSYLAAGPDYVQHHDIELLPNGNVLAIVWERHSAADAIAMGRDPARVGAEVWSETVIEIEPSGTDGGTIVWQWRVWDHLVQDFDPNLPNYGEISEFPRRIDINAGPEVPDWLHFNALDYNAELDQIVLSCFTLGEIYIISHDPNDSGDLLYRWGNPQMYGRGGPEDQKLFNQHDPEWIPAGLPGAGNITIFNNGNPRGYSSIEEIDTGVLGDGTYNISMSEPYGPSGFTTSEDEIDGLPFFSNFMSGVQRMANGNSIVCISLENRIVEINPDGNTLWSIATAGPAFRGTRFAKRDSRLEGLLWCVADFNDDDVVNTQDVLAFLNAWTADDESADFNGDGAVDTLDVLAFLNAWSSGC